jgi:enoyl-CoA hydratase/carnithine racemase
MSLVNFEVDGAVAVVTLNRPPVNALSEELSNDLLDAFDKCQDDSIRAVVVTGEPHFAAGADIKGFKVAHESGTDDTLASALVDAAWALERLEKPTIAAVRGYALGGGLELAMAADFRFMAEDAQVGQPEIKLGVIPGAGGTQRLTRIVGIQKAKDIVYSGRFVAADEALQIGLADRVVPAEELLDAAMEAARTYAKGPTKAIAAAKHAINNGTGRPMEDRIQIEAHAFNSVFRTDDAREGVSAFVEKREASFEGK